MVRLPWFIVDISRHSAVLSPVSIQHDTQSATYQQRRPRISKLWATVARMWPAPRWLWWVPNVPTSPVPRTRAVISRCSQSASRTAGKWCCQSANIFQLNCSTWTSFRPTWATPNKHPDKKFRPPVKPQKTDVTPISDLPPSPEMAYNKGDAVDERDDSLNLGGAECTTPIRLKQTEFSLKQFARRMGQANYSGFNMWNKLWVARFQQRKHRSIIQGRSRLKQVWDGPLDWETAVADVLATFKMWLLLVNFDNTEWTRWQCVVMFLKKCASKIWEVRIKGRPCNKRPATDLGECVGNNAKSNLPELPNITFMVIIHWVLNGNDLVLVPKQLQASYPDVRRWEELVDFINKNSGLKEPYILTSMFKCSLEQDELEEAYMGIFQDGQMIDDPIYGHILYNCCLSNAFKLKLGHNVKIFVVEMMRATGKEVAEQVIRPTKVLRATHVKARREQLLIIIHRLWKVLRRVEEREKRRERRMVGTRMILELMKLLIERIELIIFRPHVFVQMVTSLSDT